MARGVVQTFQMMALQASQTDSGFDGVSALATRSPRQATARADTAAAGVASVAVAAVAQFAVEARGAAVHMTTVHDTCWYHTLEHGGIEGMMVWTMGNGSWCSRYQYGDAMEAAQLVGPIVKTGLAHCVIQAHAS